VHSQNHISHRSATLPFRRSYSSQSRRDPVPNAKRGIHENLRVDLPLICDFAEIWVRARARIEIALSKLILWTGNEGVSTHSRVLISFPLAIFDRRGRRMSALRVSRVSPECGVVIAYGNDVGQRLCPLSLCMGITSFSIPYSGIIG
jgi:hypothetical protein